MLARPSEPRTEGGPEDLQTLLLPHHLINQVLSISQFQVITLVAYYAHNNHKVITGQVNNQA
jgi:hypothetical protein